MKQLESRNRFAAFVVLCLFGGVAILFLVGCGQPTLDTSTDEKMQKSMERVTRSLPPDERETFTAAIQFMVGEDQWCGGGQ